MLSEGPPPQLSFPASLLSQGPDFHHDLETPSASARLTCFQTCFFHLPSCMWNSILASDSQKAQTEIMFLILSNVDIEDNSIYS